MTNKEMDMKILELAYQHYTEKPYNAISKDALASEIDMVNTNFYARLEYLVNKDFLKPMLGDLDITRVSFNTGFNYDSVKISPLGIEHYEWEQKPWGTRFLEALKNPEKTAVLIHNTIPAVLAALIGVILGFILAK